MEATVSEREHDIVLFGATSFVGRLTADYLKTASPAGVRIALAGRSAERLEELRSSLGADWPLLVADTGDAEALRRLAESARVVATTVGPYRRYGLPVVEACAAAGTHYADLTGEAVFMRESIDRFHERAQASGARIVHSCGFDSIPSDIGVLLLHERAVADGAGRPRADRARRALVPGRRERRHDRVDARDDRGSPARPRARPRCWTIRTGSAPTAPPSPTSARRRSWPGSSVTRSPGAGSDRS